MEAALSAKMKSGLCERAADNPTLPIKEVYNQYMSSDAPLLEDDLLAPLSLFFHEFQQNSQFLWTISNYLDLGRLRISML
jgi:hypothetical protein